MAPTPAQASTPPALPPGAGNEQLPFRQPEPQLGNQRATQLKEQTIEMIRQKPINTTRAVQAWLHEETS
jgi:hypothetical protein